VFVSVKYPSVKASAITGGKLLKETILQVDVDSNSQLVMRAARLPEGDVLREKQPLMIFTARWVQLYIRDVQFSVSAMGDMTLPLSWTVTCGNTELVASRDVEIQSSPTSPTLYVQTNTQFPKDAFPLRYVVTARDSTGQTDTIAVTVTAKFAPATPICWIRPPWSDRGPGLLDPNICKPPVLAMETLSAPIKAPPLQSSGNQSPQINKSPQDKTPINRVEPRTAEPREAAHSTECGRDYPGTAYKIGGGISAPVPIYKPEPDYTEEAKHAKFQGTVLLFIVVDEKGNPRDLRVLRSLGLGLDEKAMEAVQKWKFRPGMKDGCPVPVQATIEVNFRLL
jgi:TonB family protein